MSPHKCHMSRRSDSSVVLMKLKYGARSPRCYFPFCLYPSQFIL